MELAINVIERAWRRLVAHRGADRLAADDAFRLPDPQIIDFARLSRRTPGAFDK
jgi:hypothetical protein